MAGRTPGLLLALGVALGLAGCKHPSITAVSLAPHACDDRCTFLHGCHKDPEGIPFYLPKPLLIVSKNFRNIEDAKVGLTDSAPIPNVFDDQSKYADLNARTNFNFGGDASPGAAPADPSGTPLQSDDPNAAINPAFGNGPPASTATKSGAYTYSRNAPHVTPHDVPDDGLAPNTFFTYHVVFVPDLTQKYGLKVEGGAGEIRAAMNLVNGWQFTGLGPYYMKDSSTAQNVISGGIAARLGGQAVQDVLKGVAGLSGGGKLQSSLPAGAPQVQQLARTIEGLRQETHPLMTIPNYAEIHVYEARLGPDGQMDWCEIVNLAFDRHYVGAARAEATFAPRGPAAVPEPNLQGGLPSPLGATAPAPPAEGGLDPGLAKMAVAGVFGIPADSPALVVSPTGGALQSGLPGPSGAIGAPPSAPATAPAAPRPASHGLFSHEKHKKRGVASSRVLSATGISGTTSPVPSGMVNPNTTATSPPPPPVLTPETPPK